MPKWFSLQRFLKLRVTTYILLILCVVAVTQFFASFGYYQYEHIPQGSIKDHLYLNVNPNLVVAESLPPCKYDVVLQNPKYVNSWEVPMNFDDFLPTGIYEGGFVPKDCKPLFSVAILVTYRNRESQLKVFIPYIHNFLRAQNIHYKIYVIEQRDEKPWNKGILYNIGAKVAMGDKFPCLILHDVDLLPLDLSNLYVCLDQPRHMSASIDKFRFVLIYETLVGGVLAIRSDHYQQLNGFSNRYEGWGGEDDDFAGRILSNNLEILRFPPHMSRYRMLVHAQERKNAARHRLMQENANNTQRDGLNSLRLRRRAYALRPSTLFTVVAVTL